MDLMGDLEETFGISLGTVDVLDFSSYEKGKEILAKYGVELQSIHLYTLVRQNFIRYSQSSPEARSVWRASKRASLRPRKCTFPP